MHLRFRANQIRVIAERYDDPYDEVIYNLKPGIIARRKLTGDELYTICRWKSPRRAGLAKSNEEKFVQSITSFALSTTDERARIEVLTLLKGVSWPSASVILHWFSEDP